MAKFDTTPNEKRPSMSVINQENSSQSSLKANQVYRPILRRHFLKQGTLFPGNFWFVKLTKMQPA